MREGAVLISFIYAEKQPALVQRLLDKVCDEAGKHAASPKQSVVA